jgi:hypothetical protein
MFSNMNNLKCWWKKNHISNSKCTMDEFNFLKKMGVDCIFPAI